MRNLVYLTMFFAIILFSCGSSETKPADENENDNQVIQETTENTEESEVETTNEAGDCDEFLDNYEKWVNDYIETMAKFVKDPTDQDVSQHYMELAQKASEWTSQWINLVKCASDPKYQDRYDEISEKTEKKMKELGLQ